MLLLLLLLLLCAIRSGGSCSQICQCPYAPCGRVLHSACHCICHRCRSGKARCSCVAAVRHAAVAAAAAAAAAAAGAVAAAALQRQSYMSHSNSCMWTSALLLAYGCDDDVCTVQQIVSVLRVVNHDTRTDGQVRCLCTCRCTAREMLTMGLDPSRSRTPAVTRPASSVAQAQMQRDRRLDRRFCAASIRARIGASPLLTSCCGLT